MSAELAHKLRTFAQWWGENPMNSEVIYGLHRPEGVLNLMRADLMAAADALESVAGESLAAEQERELAKDEIVYERFMRKWKLVGVWQGGKPVRAKLARLTKEGKMPEIWAGLERLQNDPNRPDAQFIPRPMTWLNQERWNDDPYPPKSGRQSAASAVLAIDLGSPEPVSLSGHIVELHAALTDRLAKRCPVCWAAPGDPCHTLPEGGVHALRTEGGL